MSDEQLPFSGPPTTTVSLKQARRFALALSGKNCVMCRACLARALMVRIARGSVAEVDAIGRGCVDMLGGWGGVGGRGW